jgi:hypothetical protein
MFSKAAAFYMQNRPSYDLSRIRTKYDAKGDPLAKLSQLILQIESFREALNQRQFFSPLQTLRRFHEREATDPRDKVFGLLGLLSDPFISPDYSMSRDEVFLTTAIRIIVSTQSLELLTGANSSTQPGLPSWSPDWSIPSKENEWQRLQYLNLYNASKGMLAPTVSVHHTSTRAILEVDGIWSERIQYVTRDLAPDNGFHRFQTTEARWKDDIGRELGFSGIIFSDWTRSLSRNDLPDDIWISEGYAEAFWQALCGGLVYAEDNYRRARHADYESYQAVVVDDKGELTRRRPTVKNRTVFNYLRPQSVNEATNQFLYAMQTMTAGRCMFITENGRIGVGPRGIRATDRLALFSGSTVPFVLRTLEDVECRGNLVERLLPQVKQMGEEGGWVCQSVHECYTVVGDAYVSGIMDGEAVGNNKGNTERIYLM